MVNHNIALCSEDLNADALAFEGWLHEEAAKKLFEISGLNFEEVTSAAKKKGFKSFTMKAKSKVTMNVLEMNVGESHNVAAVLPGTDLKDEYIVCTAHWDHLGIGTPIEGDSIYNGAADNASGTAALMVLADFEFCFRINFFRKTIRPAYNENHSFTSCIHLFLNPL